MNNNKTDMPKPRPSNILKTVNRLWLASLLIPFRLLIKGRNAIYFRHPKAILSGRVDVGRFVEIGANAYINAGLEGIRIGTYSQINSLTAIVGNVTIGNRVLIAPNCSIVCGGHRFGKGIQPRFSYDTNSKRIYVGDDVWIGAGVTIIGPVTIGHGAVIAAGTTIDFDVPPETLIRRSQSTIVSEPIL